MGHRIAELNDAALALRVQAGGDRAAFGELVRRHQGALRAFLWRLAGGAAAADDLAQDTLIRAYERIGGFRGNAAFRTWLFAIAWREFLGSRRKADAYARMLATGAESATRDAAIAGGDPDAVLDLQRGLAVLSVEERASLLLCDACGMSHNEASAALGLPLGSVKTYVARARARMRAALELQPETAKAGAGAAAKAPALSGKDMPCRIAR